MCFIFFVLKWSFRFCRIRLLLDGFNLHRQMLKVCVFIHGLPWHEDMAIGDDFLRHVVSEVCRGHRAILTALSRDI